MGKRNLGLIRKRNRRIGRLLGVFSRRRQPESPAVDDEVSVVEDVKIEAEKDDTNAEEVAEEDEGLKLDPLLWNAGLRATWETEMNWEQTQIVSRFLTRLSVALHYRGVFMDSSSVQALAEELHPDRAEILIAEPWMSRYKIKSVKAIELIREVASRSLKGYGFDKIANHGLSRDVATNAAELEAAVFAADVRNCVALAEALRKMDVQPAVSMGHSIEYALACLGDRASMARTAENLDALLTGNAIFPLPHGRFRCALELTADTWRRLSVAIMPETKDGYRMVSHLVASRTFDLARPASYIKETGIVLPAASKEIRLKAAELRRLDTEYHHNRYPSEADLNAHSSSAASEASSSVSGTGSDEEAGPGFSPDKQVSFMKVLSHIGPGDGSVVAEFGHLLEEYPVIHGPSPDFLYETLMREFPWMKSANEKAALAAALAARRGDGGFSLPPILIYGPPGIGKSRWARRLSEISKIPMHSITLAGVSSSKGVAGSERGWASARPSFPALAFSATKVANPILFVDEVDKAEPGSINGDVIAAFLPMLEKETARAYPEMYLLGNLDVSRASFVFTANSIGGLSQPFLDRVAVLHMEKPGVKSYPTIASVMASDALVEFEIDGDERATLSEKLRAAAMKRLEQGESLRGVSKAVREMASAAIWSPPARLKLVE